VALCSALLGRSSKGGLVIVGGLNLGGSLEPLHNAVTLAEMAVEKGATSILVPVSARKQMIALSDDMATKIDVQYYADPREALLKALAE
jgi:ATP-dependent Lon protease